MSAPVEDGATTRDRFLGGRVVLVQPVDGHRAGLDAALLQAAVPDDAAGRLVDLGAGSGAAGLSVVARAPAVTASLVEREPAMLAALAETLALPENARIAPRAAIIPLDLADPRASREAAGLIDGSADWVLTNPPFFAEDGRTRPAASPLKRSAHTGAGDPLADFLRAAAGLARPGGRLVLIHRAERIADVLAALGLRFGGARVLPVHPRAGAAATRILVGGLKGSRAPPAILPGLFLHDEAGGWLPGAAAILEGRLTLDLFGGASAQ